MSMSSLPPAAARPASSSEEDPNLGLDPRKRKRMISNRESARRSRMRKQQHLDDLIKQIARLQEDNANITMQLDLHADQYRKVEGDNTVLRTQVMELTDRLRSLNSVLHFIEDFSGMRMDIPEIPDPLLEPWQLPCAGMMPITASSSAAAHEFQF